MSSNFLHDVSLDIWLPDLAEVVCFQIKFNSNMQDANYRRKKKHLRRKNGRMNSMNKANLCQIIVH